MWSKQYKVSNPAAVCARIVADGGPAIDPSQPTGSADVHGCKLTWSVTPGCILMTVVSKPFYISQAQIFAELDKLFAGAA